MIANPLIFSSPYGTRTRVTGVRGPTFIIFMDLTQILPCAKTSPFKSLGRKGVEDSCPAEDRYYAVSEQIWTNRYPAR